MALASGTKLGPNEIQSRLGGMVEVYRARDAALQAPELDRKLAEAHTSLAHYNLYHAWNWVEAENEFVPVMGGRVILDSVGSLSYLRHS